MLLITTSQGAEILWAAHESNTRLSPKRVALKLNGEEEIGDNSVAGHCVSTPRSLHYHLKEMISTLFNSFRIAYELTDWLTWPVEINCSLSRADQLLHDLFTFPLFSCWTAQVNTERTNVSSTCRILSNTFSIVPLELIPKDYTSAPQSTSSAREKYNSRE